MQLALIRLFMVVRGPLRRLPGVTFFSETSPVPRHPGMGGAYYEAHGPPKNTLSTCKQMLQQKSFYVRLLHTPRPRTAVMPPSLGLGGRYFRTPPVL